MLKSGMKNWDVVKRKWEENFHFQRVKLGNSTNWCSLKKAQSSLSNIKTFYSKSFSIKKAWKNYNNKALPHSHTHKSIVCINPEKWVKNSNFTDDLWFSSTAMPQTSSRRKNKKKRHITVDEMKISSICQHVCEWYRFTLVFCVALVCWLMFCCCKKNGQKMAHRKGRCEKGQGKRISFSFK